MKILNLVFLLFLVKTATGQQAGLTESYPIHKLGYNAALAALNGQSSFTAIGQYGLNADPGSLKNYYLALEAPLFKNIGAAIQYSNYSNLLFNNKTLAISISNQFKLNENTALSIGVSSGIVNSKYDFETDYGLSIVKENADTQLPSAFPSTSKTANINQFAESQYLLGAGLFLNAKTWHIGLAIPNIIKNEVPADINTNTKVLLERPAFASIEKDFIVNSKWKIIAGSLYRFSKNEYQKGFDLNAAFWYNKKYSLGLWQQRLGSNSLSQNRPLLAVAEVVVNKVRLAYSYNLSNNSSNFTNIKQQILLRLEIDYLKKKQIKNGQSIEKQNKN